MHCSLVLLVTCVASVARSDVFNGTGDIYITYSNERQSKLRVVYRPEYPGLYSPTGFGYSKTAYVDVYQLGEESQVATAYSHLEQRKVNKKWARMRWENYGQYYYTDDLVGNISTTPYIVYGVNIVGYSSRWVYKIYKDEYPTYVVPPDMKYCILDGHQAYHHEYKCSQALVNKIVDSSMTSNNSSGYIPPNRHSNAGSMISMIVVPLLILLASLLTLTICCIRRGGCGRAAVDDAPSSVNSAEGPPTNQTSETTNYRRPFTVSRHNFPSNISSIDNPLYLPPKKLPEQPPSYMSVVTGLSEDEIRNSNCYSAIDTAQLDTEHSRNIQSSFVADDSAQCDKSNDTPDSRTPQYV